jgi:membrane associated rhomboid family serine protease
MRSTQYRYYNSSSYLPTGVKWLLISNIAIFLLYYVGGRAVQEPMKTFFALTPAMVLDHFMIWQLATYMFMHGGIEHILFNMLALWMFGTTLEQDWGTRRFLKYYFVCGIGAGICDITLNVIIGHWNIPTLGASGAIFGLLLAFGVLYPNQIVLFFFIFPMKAKYMVMIVGAIAFLGALNVNSGVSDFAHLGGMAFGYAYLRMRFSKFKVDLGYFSREYHAWKLRRAKKRFQVYLRKHGSDRDTFVN